MTTFCHRIDCVAPVPGTTRNPQSEDRPGTVRYCSIDATN